MAWPADLPLLLAGPVVRRVQPDLAAVWVALSEPATVGLRVWEGLLDGGNGGGVFEGPAPLTSGARPTRAIGRRLHVAVATVAGTEQEQLHLRPALTYSYDVTLTPESGPEQDLRSLGLLSADRAPGPLGYAPGRLPSFALPPPDLSDLSVVHGSCRLINDGNDQGPDAMPWLDTMIERTQGEPRQRPHQLYLTGDQIYADHVAVAVLPTLTALGNELLGVTEKVPINGTDWPVDQGHLPTGWRAHVLEELAHLTGTANESHLLSLAEYCAMYLLAWSPDVWPPGGRTPPGVEEDDLFRLPGEEGGGPLDRDERALLIGISTAAVDALDTHGCNGGEQDLPVAVRGEVERVCQHRDGLAGKVSKEGALIDRYRAGVGAVRRALANVPTYMAFDDHEITDDWYVTRRWVDRVTGSALGRILIRNGLVAHAVFQGEGNDPMLYREGSNDAGNADLMSAAESLVPANGGDFDKPAADTLQALLGLGDAPTSVRWNYQVPGTRHHAIVLDTRTRRAYGGDIAAAALIAPDEIDVQVPEGPLPTGVEVLFVISGTPILGLPLIETIGGGVYAAVNSVRFTLGSASRPGHLDPDREAWAHDPVSLEALLRRLAPYRRVVVLAGDVHYGMSAAMTYWDDAGEASRIVQLTSSGTCNTWPSFVSGTVRSFGTAARLLTAGSPVEQLAWHEARPLPISLPSDVVLHPSVRFRLDRSPVLVLNHGWPQGAAIARDPDWAWRLDVLADQRPVEELPQAARPVLRDDVDPTDGFEAYDAVARRHGGNLASITNSPRMVWLHNLGVVSFSEDGEDGEDGSGLRVRHDLYSRHPRGEPPDAFDAYTSHQAPLDTTEPAPSGLRESAP